jgi:hypothetical protein
MMAKCRNISYNINRIKGGGSTGRKGQKNKKFRQKALKNKQKRMLSGVK